MLRCEDCLWRRTRPPHPLAGRLQGLRADLWQEEEVVDVLGFGCGGQGGPQGLGLEPLTLLPGPGVPLSGDSPHSSLQMSSRGRPPQQLEGPASAETLLAAGYLARGSDPEQS